MANSQNLTNTEERVVIKHTIYLVARGSPPPRLQDVADIANTLRTERGMGHVGLN